MEKGLLPHAPTPPKTFILVFILLQAFPDFGSTIRDGFSCHITKNEDVKPYCDW